MKLKQVCEAVKKICPTCGHSMAGYHYYYKGAWRCKSTSLANPATVGTATSPTPQSTSTVPAATSTVKKAWTPTTPSSPKTQPKVTTPNTLESWLAKHKITNYTINPDGSIDVQGSVFLDEFHGTRLPVKFNKVGGSFECGGGALTTLVNCPMTVGGDFRVHYNDLESLIGFPLHVGGCCDISGNPELTSLEGINGLTVGEDFNAERLTNIKSLKGIHKQIKSVGGEIDFSQGGIKSNILGTMMIRGVTKVYTDNPDADEIMNTHLTTDRDPIAAQDEMMDAGMDALSGP